MPSQQIQHLSLCMHWRGRQSNVSGQQGVIGIKPNSDVQFFHPSAIDYIDGQWHVLLSFERAHGWLSVQCLKAPEGICVNGHLLSSGPLLIKEATLMLPPHSNESIELFLCESLAEWEQVLRHDTSGLAAVGLGDNYPKYASQETVIAEKVARQLAAHLNEEYGLVDREGVVTGLVSSYNFGALRFEVMDDECWVYADDGILKINNKRVVTAQLYVGDQIQWQNNSWYLAGRSQLQRPEEAKPLIRKRKIKQSLSGDELFPVDDTSISKESFVETAKQVEQSHAELEGELVDFRAKLATWLDVSIRTSSDTPDFYRPISESVHQRANEPTSQMALLRLSRRGHAMRDYDPDGPEHFKPGLIQAPQELNSRYKAFSSRQIFTVLTAVLLGAICGIILINLQ